MSGLEQTFYIMAIIYMAITFLLMIALVVGLFIIRSKILAIQNRLEESLGTLSNLFAKGSTILETAKRIIAKAHT